jgi:membrane-bound metal-dependent hydrolase YbcI (DUF457 family)
MPLPVGHFLMGASVAEALLPSQARHRHRMAAAMACLAIVPDFDFLAVWWLDDRGIHRGLSHSLAFSLLVGLAIYAIAGQRRLRESAVCTLVIASHGLLDALTSFRSRGVELLWPFTTARYKFPITAFWEPAAVADGASTAIMGMLRTSLLELALFLPLYLAVVGLRRRLSSSYHSMP